MSECVFCTSNSTAFEEFKRNVISYLKARPEIDIFDLWPPDSVPWCNCSNCVALGSESERHAIVVEAIRTALKKVRPGVKLGILAYVQYTEFPERTPISPKVRLDFCPIYRDYKSTLNDVVSDLNRAVYWDKLLRWKNAWKGEIEIYEYYMKYRFRSFPIMMPRLIADEHSIHERLGIRGMSNYSEPDTWLAYEISHYILAICGWNGTVDAEKEVMNWASLRVGENLSGRLDEALKLIEGNLRGLYSGHFGFHSLCTTGKLSVTRDEMLDRVNALKRALEILDEIAKSSPAPGSKAWIEHLGRALYYGICDFEVQIAWDQNGSRQIALENYRKSLTGPQEDFDGVIHYGEEGRRELATHYDSNELKPHW